MRRTSKILAFVLAMLMIVGMLPLSVFAGDGSVSNKNNVLTPEAEKPTGENQTLKEYVESNGGTLLFGTSFDDASKYNASGDGKVTSSLGGSGSLGRVNMTAGDANVTVDTAAGALRLTAADGKKGDVWPYFASGADKVANDGKKFVIEFVLSVNKSVNGDIQLAYTVDDGPASGNDDRNDARFANLGATADGKVGLKLFGVANPVYTFGIGEKVTLALLVDPVLLRVYAYANGEYVGMGELEGNRPAIYTNGTRTDIKYPNVHGTVRFLQITSTTGPDVSLYDMYAYLGVDAPYKTKGTPASISQDLKALGANIQYNNSYTRIDNEATDPDGDGIYAFPISTNVSNGINVGTFDKYLGTKAHQTLHSKTAAAIFDMRYEDAGNGYVRFGDIDPNSGAHNYSNIFMNGSYDKSKESVFVLQFDIRGDGYNALRGVQVISRPSGKSAIFKDIVQIGSHQIKAGGKVIGGVAKDEFTTVTVAVDMKNNKMAVAINGEVRVKDVAVFSDTEFADQNGIAEIRINLNSSKSGGYIDFDNFLIYSYNVPSGKTYANSFAGYAGDYDGKAKWVQTADGHWRYYDANGAFTKSGTQSIGGYTYHFDSNGYYSIPERDWLLNFDAKRTDSTLTMFDGFAANDRLYASTLQTGLKPDGSSWKYSALWAHLLYEGFEQGTLHVNAPFYVNANMANIDMKAGAEYVNPKYTRKTTQADIDKLTGWVAEKNGAAIPDSKKRVAGADYIFDFADYEYIEFKYYGENLTGLYPKIILENLNYDIRSATDVRRAYARKDDFSFVDKTVNGGGTYTLKVSDYPKTVTQIRFQNTWDGGQYRGDYSRSLFFFQEVNLVKYTPYTGSEAPTVVRTDDNGNTAVYLGSDQAYGWTKVGEDTYYCNSRGVAFEGVMKYGDKYYAFGEDGKLITGDDDGVYSINGKKYYVAADGTVGRGNHTVNGVSFYTNHLGEITLEGELPYINYNAFKLTDLNGKTVFYNIDFQNQITENPTAKPTKGTSGNQYADRNVPYFGSHMETPWNVCVLTTGMPAGYTFTANMKQTRYYYVKEADGNVALKMFNMNTEQDPYMDLNYPADAVPNDLIVEASFKLGEDWNAEMTLISLQDRRISSTNYGVFVNKEGYIYVGLSNGTTRIIGQLRTDEYTKVSIHKYTSGTRQAVDVYINDVKVINNWGCNGNMKGVQFVRFAQYSKNRGQGTMYIDNVVSYSGAKTPVVTTPYATGAVKFGDYYRYYDGHNFYGNMWQVSDDGEYWYDKLNALRFTETGFVDGFYLIDGAKQQYVGATLIPGTEDKYFFQNNFKVLAQELEKYVDPNNNDYAYDIDATGKIVAEYYRGQILATENAGFANTAAPDGSANEGDYVFDAEAGQNVFVPKNGTFTVRNFGELTDITAYSFLNLRMKSVNGAKYHLVFGYNLIQEITGYEISGADYVADQVSDEDSTDIALKDLTFVEGDVYKLVEGENTRYFKVTVSEFGASTEYTVSGDAWADVSIALSAYSPELLENVEYINVVIDSDVAIENATLIGYYDATAGGEALEGWQGDRYYVDGFPVQGWQEIEDRWFYFDPITGLKTVGLAKLPVKPEPPVDADGDFLVVIFGECYYVFSEGGSLIGVADGMVDTTVYVYDAETETYNAKKVTRVFEDGVPVTGGYTDSEGNNYYINDTDSSIITDTYIDTDNDGIGDTYLGEDGLPTVVANKWVQDGDEWSYIGANGQKVKGFVGLKLAPGETEEGATKYYFFDPDGYLVKNAFVDVDGDQEVDLYMDANGNPANGIVENEDFGGQFNTMYFVNGVGTANEMVVDEDDTAYLYSFDATGMLVAKTEITSDGPVVLIKVVKDGKADTFVFALDENGSFEKVDKAFEGYACYYIVIKNEATGEVIATGENHAELKFPTDITIAASTTYVVSYVPVEHDYVLNEALSVAPGCLTDGKNVYTCANCGYTYFDVVAATGMHVFDEDTKLVVLAPNCWRPGLVEYTCECGYIKNEEIAIDPDNHSALVEAYTDTNGDGVIDDLDKETCTQAATLYGECKDCGYFGYEVKMADHESDGKWFFATEADVPTCVSKGLATSTCVNCGTTMTKVVNSDPSYHPYANLLNKGIEHEDGANVSIYNYNAEENKIDGKTEAEIIAEHYSLFQLIQDSTCTVNGLAIYRCLDCGEFITGAVPTVQEKHVWPEDGILEEKQEMCGYVTYDKYHCLHCNENKNQPEYDEIEAKFEEIKAAGETEYVWVELGFKIEIVAADGNHSYDYDTLYTVSDPTDPLFGYHFNLCYKCFKAMNVVAHEFGDYNCNGDGTHSRGCDCLEYTVEDGVLLPSKTTYVLTEECVADDEMYIDPQQHGETCIHCEGNFDLEPHNIVSGIVDGRHVHYCDVCDYIAYDIDVDGEAVDKLDPTCHDTGYTAHVACTYDGCDYKTDDYEVLGILEHKYSKDTLCSNFDTHWYECELCGDKLFEESHKWESIDALAATCVSAGYNAHERCEECLQVKKGSVVGVDGSALSEDLANIPAFGHLYGANVYNNATHHWQYCERIITLLDGTTVACTHIGVPDGDDDHANDTIGEHTYTNYDGKTGYDYEDYNDEFGTGFRYCDYEGCQHKEWSDDLPTWWGDLGLKLFVDEAGNRRYYLEVNGEKVTDYVTELTDSHTGITGVYYFDANGYLVLAGDWTEGTATNANPYTGAKDGDKFHTVKADSFAARGAIIAEVVITASNGTYKVIADATANVSAYVLATGWQMIENKYYFFYDPNMENVADDAKGGYNAEYSLTAKGKMLTGATIYAYAYDKYTKTYVDNRVILCNLNAEGAHLLGIVMDGEDAYFYLDGHVGKMSGRFEDSYWCENDPNYNDIYFTHADGKLYSGKHISVDGVYYSFGGDRTNQSDNTVTAVGKYVMVEWHAHQILNFYVDADGVQHDTVVYTDGEGKIITDGWFMQEGAGGYYIANGEMVKNAEAYEADGFWYDIDADGVAANRTGWIEIEGNKAYVIESILLVSKFLVVSETEAYYFDSDGYLLKAEEGTIDVYIGTTPYVIDVDGLATASTLKDHWVRFLDADGKLSEMVGYYFHTTGLARGLYVGTIGGATYYFDANGVMQKDYKYYDAINDKYYMFNASGIGSEVTKEEYEEDETV